jgi:hypothetical protein
MPLGLVIDGFGAAGIHPRRDAAGVDVKCIIGVFHMIEGCRWSFGYTVFLGIIVGGGYRLDGTEST